MAATILPLEFDTVARDVSRLVCGIDPGITGAIAILDGEQLMECWDMPTVKRSAAKSSNKQEVNAAALAAILRGRRPALVYVERVNAMPNTATKRGMGAASAFNFGDSFGRIIGVLAALEIPYDLVHPQTWKKRAGLIGADKDFSRTLAQQLYPAAELARKKDVGRAEAILIARYGSPQ